MVTTVLLDHQHVYRLNLSQVVFGIIIGESVLYMCCKNYTKFCGQVMGTQKDLKWRC